MEATPIYVGQHPPNWSMKNQDGKTVKLADFKGKQAVVLVFYPGDMTPGCTMQLCAIRDNWDAFRSAGIAVLGINHAGETSHRAFSEKHGFPFPLLTDPNKKTSAAYGAVKKIFKTTIIKRSVVGIDKDGIVRYCKRGMPKNAEILKSMKSFA